MVEPSNQSSLGARFRAAGWEEKPLQVAGAINTYTARLAQLLPCWMTSTDMWLSFS